LHNIDNGGSEEDTQSGEQGTTKGKGTKDGKGKGKANEDGNGKGKGKGKGNGNSKGIIEHTEGCDDISRAVALQLPKGMCETNLDPEG